jgi:ferredoxin
MTEYPKYWKQVKARKIHHCSTCEVEIGIGECYWRESIEDKFLHIINPKKLCHECHYEQDNYAEKKEQKL